jgi:Na+-translocating ferredoxin:NAD+ oxidoreductase subunit E
MSALQNFSKGIYKENPVFRLALGLCPTLATSSSIENAIGMGVATTFVLFSSNTLVSLLISAFKKIFGEEGMKDVDNVRIPIFIVIIASFVTIVDLTMQAYFPALSESLGIFIPLIVVNCIILGRAEGFASKNGVFSSILDALGMGLGFTFALVAIAVFRELLGNGSLAGINIFGASFEPVILMILPPGAFLVVGFYLGFFNWLDERKAGKRS